MNLRNLWPPSFGKGNHPRGEKKRFSLLQVEPTLDCNLRCSMCPWLDLHQEGGQMEWTVFEKVSPCFREAKEIDFTGGGEPLLHPRLAEMVAGAKFSGCRVGFSTNATLLDDSRGRELLEAGLDWIAFSLDGATSKTYESIRLGASFARVMDNIGRFQEMQKRRGKGKAKTMFVFVMMKENIHELPQMIDLAHRLGIEQVVAKNLDVISKEENDERRVFKHEGEGSLEESVTEGVARAQKRAKELKVPLRVYELSLVEKPICEQDPLNTLFVAYDGSVSPCINLSYLENRCFGGQHLCSHVSRFGKLAEESLEAIWQKPDYENFRGRFRSRFNRYSRNLMDFLTSDLGYREVKDWPMPPRGCAPCYYLYGV